MTLEKTAVEALPFRDGLYRFAVIKTLQIRGDGIPSTTSLLAALMDHPAYRDHY